MVNLQDSQCVSLLEWVNSGPNMNEHTKTHTHTHTHTQKHTHTHTHPYINLFTCRDSGKLWIAVQNGFPQQWGRHNSLHYVMVSHISNSIRPMLWTLKPCSLLWPLSSHKLTNGWNGLQYQIFFLVLLLSQTPPPLYFSPLVFPFKLVWHWMRVSE